MSTLYPKLRPVRSLDNLRERIDRLLGSDRPQRSLNAQLALDIGGPETVEENVICPGSNVTEFLDFTASSTPDGDLYLFGGVLRDIALFGQRGFSSDIDLVVDGSWNVCIPFLESLGATKNRFGGFRLQVGGWPIDIWNARETWAVVQGYVEYNGIHSLLDTTVLNWDAVLMNWRTRRFVCGENYLERLNDGYMDIVLERNPNPLGMAVRVFRHLSLKYTRKISLKTAFYMARCANRYSYAELVESEVNSYGNQAIEHALYMMLREFGEKEKGGYYRRQRDEVRDELLKQGVTVPQKQQEFFLNLPPQ